MDKMKLLESIIITAAIVGALFVGVKLGSATQKEARKSMSCYSLDLMRCENE